MKFLKFDGNDEYLEFLVTSKKVHTISFHQSDYSVDDLIDISFELLNGLEVVFVIDNNENVCKVFVYFGVPSVEEQMLLYNGIYKGEITLKSMYRFSLHAHHDRYFHEIEEDNR